MYRTASQPGMVWVTGDEDIWEDESTEDKVEDRGRRGIEES